MNITHEIVDEGLTLESTYVTSTGGQAKARVSWSTLEKAEQNYDKAKVAFEARIPYYEEAVGEVIGVRRSRLRKTGPILFFTNSGAPTWWLPRISLIRRGFGIGWLRFAFSVQLRERKS